MMSIVSEGANFTIILRLWNSLFFMWIIFKVFIEFFTALLLFYVFFVVVVVVLFCFAMKHVGSWLPNQGLNPHPLHWKMKS